MIEEDKIRLDKKNCGVICHMLFWFIMLILICHPLSSKKPADPPPFPLPFPTFPPNIANLTTININTCYLLARSFRIRSFHHETTGTLLLKDATGCIGPGPPGCKSRTSRPGRTGCTFIRGEGKDVCDNLTFKGKSQLQMHVYCIRCKRMKYLKINTEEHKTLRERERQRVCVSMSWCDMVLNYIRPAQASKRKHCPDKLHGIDPPAHVGLWNSQTTTVCRPELC